MKPKPSSHSKSFKPLILWRDDLEKIAAILTANGGKAEFESSEISFENLSELVEKFGTIHPITALDISGEKPYARISLSHMDARLYVAATENGSGVFFELDKVLAPRQRRWPFLYSYPFICIIIVLNFWPVVIKYLFGLESGYAGITSDVVLLSWILWVNFVRLRRYSVIKLVKHSERTSFFHRKKDDLILVVVSAIIGFALGVMGTRLMDKAWPTSNGGQTTSSEKPK